MAFCIFFFYFLFLSLYEKCNRKCLNDWSPSWLYSDFLPWYTAGATHQGGYHAPQRMAGHCLSPLSEPALEQALCQACRTQHSTHFPSRNTKNSKKKIHFLSAQVNQSQLSPLIFYNSLYNLKLNKCSTFSQIMMWLVELKPSHRLREKACNCISCEGPGADEDLTPKIWGLPTLLNHNCHPGKRKQEHRN